jgi:hypothetical protein
MSELKTKPNQGDVAAFLRALDHSRRRDCQELSAMMEAATGCKATMWGDSIVGFGRYHYLYASGTEGDWFQVGFSPRKANLALYILPGLHRYADLMGALGKHSTGKSCLYIKRLDDVDRVVLRKLVHLSVAHVAEMYPAN